MGGCREGPGNGCPAAATVLRGDRSFGRCGHSRDGRSLKWGTKGVNGKENEEEKKKRKVANCQLLRAKALAPRSLRRLAWPAIAVIGEPLSLWKAAGYFCLRHHGTMLHFHCVPPHFNGDRRRESGSVSRMTWTRLWVAPLWWQFADRLLPLKHAGLSPGLSPPIPATHQPLSLANPYDLDA